ncbi:CPBP family intramembrane glutamic endopeptidase [Bacillus sp. UNCCL13]|uniref:CPBP family intramembrane glutamic endopeptidase n=1 Tax=Bacillus sp. UNCCL13 TaxID=1502772 RepID=UPI000B8161BC|nr:type II CAAX endopeptidase family protein [Bacillus sp. UNCCL13]
MNSIYYIFHKEYRLLSSLLNSFLVGFLFFQIASNQLGDLEITKELIILLNRCLLIIIILAMIFSQILNKRRITFFTKIPEWSRRISLPFHSIRLSYFLLISFLFSFTILIPPFFLKETDIDSVLLFALFFSFINATLEEFIWRGILLSGLREYVSSFYAIIITSLGFGLYHISIGIPLIFSLLFAFGGLFYSIVVLKSNSIYPAILLHIVINIGMVLNGWII